MSSCQGKNSKFLTQVTLPYLAVPLQIQVEDSDKADFFVSPKQLSANTQAQDTIERIPDNLGSDAPTLTPYLSTGDDTSKLS